MASGTTTMVAPGEHEGARDGLQERRVGQHPDAPVVEAQEAGRAGSQQLDAEQGHHQDRHDGRQEQPPTRRAAGRNSSIANQRSLSRSMRLERLRWPVARTMMERPSPTQAT